MKLSEFLEQGGFELFKYPKELLIAPIGSGKTYLLMNKCKEFNRVLYLIDTDALKTQVKNDLEKRGAFIAPYLVEIIDLYKNKRSAE